MRKFLQWLFKKPITRLADRVSSAPNQRVVFHSLGRLLAKIRSGKKNKGLVKWVDFTREKMIIFSDQHKGTRDNADDFRAAEKNYLTALDYYHQMDFQFISLGDCEELWKYTPQKVMTHNDDCFAAEKKFMEQDHFFKLFGNHDLAWKYKLQQNIFLKHVFGDKIKVYEGLLLQIKYGSETYAIFMAHGHQGDLRSDGNPLSAWIVANIWTPVQRYLQISINTPATSFELSDKHNIMMHNWSSAQKHLIFISGHTHKPVFASLDHVDRLTKQLHQAKMDQDQQAADSIGHELEIRKKEYEGKKELKTEAKPCYFNTGCCCFDDGDITGIEIAEGAIRLVKWYEENGKSIRIILEQSALSQVFEELV